MTLVARAFSGSPGTGTPIEHIKTKQLTKISGFSRNRHELYEQEVSLVFAAAHYPPVAQRVSPWRVSLF